MTLQGNANTMAEMYKAVSDNLLDGMPCDRANSILAQEEDSIQWERNVCVHESYWKAVGYANHLQRHIDKENSVVFPFAQRQLPPEVMEKVEIDAANFEKKAIENHTPSHFLEILDRLEKKYNN